MRERERETVRQVDDDDPQPVILLEWAGPGQVRLECSAAGSEVTGLGTTSQSVSPGLQLGHHVKGEHCQDSPLNTSDLSVLPVVRSEVTIYHTTISSLSLAWPHIVHNE